MSTQNLPCAACKFLRRKCTQECVFAPYFPPEQPQKFANVYKVFGASNVSKLLNELNTAQREDAVNSLAYEAEARLRDPVYGCVGLISILQRRLKELLNDLYAPRKQLVQYNAEALLPTHLQSPAYLPHSHRISIPSSSSTMLHSALPMLGTPTDPELADQQFLLTDPGQQLQKVLRAQRLAGEPQEIIFRAYEQKKEVLNRDFQVTVASISPSLGLGNFDASYQIQPQLLDHHQQQQPQQQQQIQAELFLLQQQPQPQPQPQPLQSQHPQKQQQ